MVPSGAAESGTGCAPEALTNEKAGRPDGAPTIEVRSRLKPAAAPAKSDQSSSSTETAPHPMPPSAWPSECGHGGGLPPYSHTWALNDADQRLRPDPQPYCSLPPPLDPESGHAMLLAPECVAQPAAWRVSPRRPRSVALPRHHEAALPTCSRTHAACMRQGTSNQVLSSPSAERHAQFSSPPVFGLSLGSPSFQFV